MIKKMYSIYDQKAGVFNNPFYKTTHGEAERDFTTAVNDEKTTLNQYPTDFDLYYLGDYNDQDGKFTTLDTPQHVVKAVQVLRQKSASLS